MAFFGITNLGYQNPIGDKMLVNPRRPASSHNEIGSCNWTKPSGQSPVPVHRGDTECMDNCANSYTQPPPFSTDIHRGSQQRYKEMLKRAQTPRSPNQLYSMPITESQQCGWWITSGGLKTQECWTQVKRFPRRNSEMTKFVEEMSMTDREFSLF
ncbi:hypothetical protein DPEC_G00005600 [Dallia pectoralis]|uniref:Uncharacterized protein n=1 Tax=Dallia pectoralis TaxID=75939 RepID=A0ACC2HJX1_DALPE|nr:hypothetical protein DPEC_G00005600 [Dallia pectoralis]